MVSCGVAVTGVEAVDGSRTVSLRRLLRAVDSPSGEADAPSRVPAGGIWGAGVGSGACTRTEPSLMPRSVAILYFRILAEEILEVKWKTETILS